MMCSKTFRTILIGISSLLILFGSGCSVFSSIGDAISQGYENTISYFNGYYNAKRLFSDAEDAIASDTLTARAKGIAHKPTDQIPQAAKQKLTQVIDKCSNILAFHPTSNLVDDALLMIGKSFFYQSEYLKAERKFTELLVQYPKSALILEVQLWLARSEEKLGKTDEGIRLCQVIIPTAKSDNEKDIEIEAHRLLALLYTRIDDLDKSVGEYEKALALTSDKDIKRDVKISLGDVYFSNEKFDKAIEAYLQAKENSSDRFRSCYSGLRAAISYRALGQTQKAIELLNSMINDFRNKEFLPGLLLERANNYDAEGRRDDAIAEYIYIDTTYSKSDDAARSAYRLGVTYEREVGDYQKALKYYGEVNSIPTADSIAKSRQKFSALTRYFEDWHKLILADSLMEVLSDTTRKIAVDSAQTAAVSADVPEKPSPRSHQKTAVADTLKTRAAMPVNMPRTMDSLKIVKSVAAQELGDLFYNELPVPDSAFYWYNRSLTMDYDSVRSPRILYILGEISRTYPEKKYSAPDEFFKRLEHDFPGSIYTSEAQRLLGKNIGPAKSDTALEYYKEAEKNIDAKQYRRAIEKLKRIVQLFPLSPYAAKSEYAIGWIYEKCMDQPDSAKIYYRNVLGLYPKTVYAANLSRMMLDTVRSDTTAKIKTVPVPVKNDTVKTLEGSGERKPPEIKGSGRDTTAAKVTEPANKPKDPREEVRKIRGQNADSTRIE